MGKKQPSTLELKKARDEKDEQYKKKGEKLRDERNQKVKNLLYIQQNLIVPIRLGDISAKIQPHSAEISDDIITTLDRDHDKTGLTFLKLFLTDKIISLFIDGVNTIFDKIKSHYGKDEDGKKKRAASEYCKIDSEDMWRYIIKWSIHTLKSTQGESDISGELSSIESRISGNRFSHLNKHFNDDGTIFNQAREEFSANAHNIFKGGTVTVIDEMLLSYYGYDSIFDKTWSDNKSKPHSKGITVYGISHRLANTGLPALFNIIPKDLSNKNKPFQMAHQLIKDFRQHNKDPQILVCDCIFSLHTHAKLLSKLNFNFFSATRQSGNQDFHMVKELVKDQLTSTNSFLFQHRSMDYTMEFCLRSKANDDKSIKKTQFVVIMVTNNYKYLNDVDSSLFVNDCEDSLFIEYSKLLLVDQNVIKKLLNCSDSTTPVIDLIYDRLKVNLLKPPKGNSWSKSLLKELKKKHLCLIYEDNIKSSSDGIKKPQLIEELLLPSNRSTSSSANNSTFNPNINYTQAQLQGYLDDIISKPIPNSERIHDIYLYNYGLIDRIDAAYYLANKPETSGSYRTLFAHHLIFCCIYNAYNCYVEYNTKKNVNFQRETLNRWWCNIIIELSNQYPHRSHKKNKINNNNFQHI